MSSVNLIFPGQGSQYVGMGKEQINNPKNAQLISEVNASLGFDLIDIMLNGPEEKLTLTQYTQPAIVLHSYLLFLEMKEELSAREINIDTVMGHSVGEYSALVAAGSINILDALKAVHLRGKYMQEAVPAGMGKMLAVLKVSQEKIEEGCMESSTDLSKVMPANYNAPNQIVVSGHADACDRFSNWMNKNMESSFRVVPLKVSAPFHSSLMAPAAENLKKYLESVSLNENKIAYIANIDAKKYAPGTSPETIKGNLINQVEGSVLWTQSFSQLDENQSCFEIGPGKTLMGLGRSINRNIKIKVTDGPSVSELFS